MTVANQRVIKRQRGDERLRQGNDTADDDEGKGAIDIEKPSFATPELSRALSGPATCRPSSSALAAIQRVPIPATPRAHV